MQQENITISIPLYVQVKNPKVLIEDIVKLGGSNEALIKRLGKETYYNFKDKNTLQVLSDVRLISFLENKCPGLSVSNNGETEFILEYKKPEEKNQELKRMLEIAKVLFVALAVFFGSAFTIMTFNSDVDVGGVFDILYQLTDEAGRKWYTLEISYSIGIFVGISAFFNHISCKKAKHDPTPLEAQMHVYEDGINKAIIEQMIADGKLDTF